MININFRQESSRKQRGDKKDSPTFSTIWVVDQAMARGSRYRIHICVRFCPTIRHVGGYATNPRVEPKIQKLKMKKLHLPIHEKDSFQHLRQALNRLVRWHPEEVYQLFRSRPPAATTISSSPKERLRSISSSSSTTTSDLPILRAAIGAIFLS
jgi:hypothetical protein